jgi:hypothetical protein
MHNIHPLVGITGTVILDPGRRTLDFASVGLHRLDSISAAGDGLVAISLRALDKPFPARWPQTSWFRSAADKLYGARRASHRIVIYRCVKVPLAEAHSKHHVLTNARLYYVTCQVEPDVNIVEGSWALAHGLRQTRAEKQEIIGPKRI